MRGETWLSGGDRGRGGGRCPYGSHPGRSLPVPPSPRFRPHCWCSWPSRVLEGRSWANEGEVSARAGLRYVSCYYCALSLDWRAAPRGQSKVALCPGALLPRIWPSTSYLAAWMTLSFELAFLAQPQSPREKSCPGAIFSFLDVLGGSF